MYFSSFLSLTKKAKFTPVDVLFKISRQVFTAMWCTMSHFKGDKMGFSEKIYLIIKTQNISEKKSLKQHKLFIYI